MRFQRRWSEVLAASLAAILGAGPVARADRGGTHEDKQTRLERLTTTALKEKVQNIVVIYAENRSFDSLYGAFPGAHGLGDVTHGNGSPDKHYIRQKDRDGVTVLSKLPLTWNGVTAGSNPQVVTQAQSDDLPNAPFSIETGFTPLLT
jgi:phospholipase C